KQKDLERQVRQAKNPPKTPEEKAQRARLSHVKGRTKLLREKMKNEDFSKREPIKYKKTPELIRAEAEMDLVVDKWNRRLLKFELNQRTIAEKAFDTALRQPLNTARAIMSSLDLSAVLRQGGFVTMGGPLRAFRAFPAMFKSLGSERGRARVEAEIRAREIYPEAMKSDLFLAEQGTMNLNRMEEAFMGRWADKIPGVAASQRAYTSFLNKLRIDTFETMVRTLAKTGKATPQEMKAVARFVNIATGRGAGGRRLENALTGLNTYFWAPRLVASRFQLAAAPLTGFRMGGGSMRTRKMFAKEYGKFLIGAMTTYALADAAGAEISFDPRSSDFGKIKIGNTRIDPLAGLSQAFVVATRLGGGEFKSASTGRVSKMRGPFEFGGTNTDDVFFRFMRSKFSPAMGAAYDIVAGENMVGEPTTALGLLESHFTPLVIQDIREAIEDQGFAKGSALGMLAIWGVGLQTWAAKAKKRRKGAIRITK
ncbi:MAG: hypothetical protein GY953_42170, partial [bacterium]|nr:hypothetical protein [bacterium]